MGKRGPCLREASRLREPRSRRNIVMSTDNATSRAAALTSTSEQLVRGYRNESNVKVDLSQLIGMLGYGPVETEHSIPGGSIDI